MQTLEIKPKKKKRKKSKNKISKLRDDLLQQQCFFEEFLRLIKVEADELQKNLDQLDKGTPSNDLYKKVSNRQKEIFEKKTNKNYNEYMKYFFTDVSDFKEKVWEEAANKL